MVKYLTVNSREADGAADSLIHDLMQRKEYNLLNIRHGVVAFFSIIVSREEIKWRFHRTSIPVLVLQDGSVP